MGIKEDKKLVKFLEEMSNLLPNLQEISLNIEEVDITTKSLNKQIKNKFNDKTMIKDRFKYKQENIGIYDLSKYIEIFVNKNGFIFMKDLSCKNKNEYNKDILCLINNNNNKNIKNTLYEYCINYNWNEYDDILTQKRNDSIKDLAKCFNKISKKENVSSSTTQNNNENNNNNNENWKNILKNKWYLSSLFISILNENYNILNIKDIKNIKSKKLKKIKNCKIGEIKRFKWNKKKYFKNLKSKKYSDKSDKLPSMEILFKENNINNKIINIFKNENIQISSWRLAINDKQWMKEIGINSKDIKKLKYLCDKLQNDYFMKFDE